MNYGILHNRRPAKASSSEGRNPLLNDVRMREMAKQMGLEPKDFGKEAMELWKTLDSMAENDPNAYQRFISDQLKDGPPVNDSDTPKPLRAFNPKPGYVVKCGMLGPVKQQMVEVKLFVNLCFHEVIDLPKNPNSGREVPQDTRAVSTTNNLQIPLVIGSLREIQDVNGSPCRAIDVVFHPWVHERCKWDANFKRDIMNLSITWVQQDAKITLTSRISKFIKSAYKGGVTVGGEIITARFPIVPEQQQSRTIDVKLFNMDNQSKESVERLKTEKPSEEPPTQKIAMSTPSDLLKQINGCGENCESGFVIAPADQHHSPSQDVAKVSVGQSALKKNLIEIIEPDNKQEFDCKLPKQVKSKPNAPVVKRGFLNATKKPLYPNGSCEGKPASAYVNLLSRSKVVDLTKDQIKQKDAGTDRQSQSRLNGMLRETLSTVRSTEAEERETDHADFEFEQLCADADPELAPRRAHQGEGTRDGALGEQLDQFAKLLSSQY